MSNTYSDGHKNTRLQQHKMLYLLRHERTQRIKMNTNTTFNLLSGAFVLTKPTFYCKGAIVHSKPGSFQRIFLPPFQTFFDIQYDPLARRPVARPLLTQNTTQYKKMPHTSMPQVQFEPTIPVFEWQANALYRSATVIRWNQIRSSKPKDINVNTRHTASQPLIHTNCPNPH
jgi:hypothetical protein